MLPGGRLLQRVGNQQALLEERLAQIQAESDMEAVNGR